MTRRAPRVDPAPRTSSAGRLALSATVLVLACLVGGALVTGWQTQTTTVAATVGLAVRGAGALACLWYAASALVSILALTVESAGGSWRAGRRALDRWGPRLVRRIAGTGALTGLAVAGVLAPGTAATQVPDNLTSGVAASEVAVAPGVPVAPGAREAASSLAPAGAPSGTELVAAADAGPTVEVIPPGSGAKTRPAPADPEHATERPTSAPRADDGAVPPEAEPAVSSTPAPSGTTASDPAPAQPLPAGGDREAPATAPPAPAADPGAGAPSLRTTPQVVPSEDGAPTVDRARDAGPAPDDGRDAGHEVEPPTSTGPGARPSPPPAAEQAPSPATAAPDGTVATYTVLDGDSLWRIAEQFGASGAEETSRAWQRWYDLNADVIGSDPDLIHPGTTLTVPEKE